MCRRFVRPCRRKQLIWFFVTFHACTVVMEACAGAQYMARKLRRFRTHHNGSHDLSSRATKATSWMPRRSAKLLRVHQSGSLHQKPNKSSKAKRNEPSDPGGGDTVQRVCQRSTLCEIEKQHRRQRDREAKDGVTGATRWRPDVMLRDRPVAIRQTMKPPCRA